MFNLGSHRRHDAQPSLVADDDLTSFGFTNLRDHSGFGGAGFAEEPMRGISLYGLAAAAAGGITAGLPPICQKVRCPRRPARGSDAAVRIRVTGRWVKKESS